MTLFIITLLITIIALIVCIIFSFKLYIRKKRNKKIVSINSRRENSRRKKENRQLIMSISGIIISAIATIYTLCNSVPTPIIYPLDNEARVYNGMAKVTINSYPLLKTYYTLDGSNPEDGYNYEGSFNITKTTTVSAKNKFLIFWSGLSQSTFRFENAQNITVSAVDNNADDHITIKEFFTYIIIILFIIAMIVGGRE